MRCFWEQIGALGPIYRLLGKGLNDSDIAKELNLTEMNIQSCAVWMLHFLKMGDGQKLVLYALAAAWFFYRHFSIVETAQKAGAVHP